MTSVPAGQRLWKCPECGTEALLPITQLDPMACDACMAKLKGGSAAKAAVANGSGSTLAQQESIRRILVGLGLLVFGLVAGFVAGRMTAPQPSFVRPTRPSEESAGTTGHPDPKAQPEADVPDESTRPGPGYNWVRGYTRKDGVSVRGHWARDPNFGEHDKESKKRKK